MGERVAGRDLHSPSPSRLPFSASLHSPGFCPSTHSPRPLGSGILPSEFSQSLSWLKAAATISFHFLNYL